MKSIKITLVIFISSLYSCNTPISPNENKATSYQVVIPDTTTIPSGPFGEAVKYGRELMLNTSYYIGPNGINGKYLGNKMNCTHCHQDAGTKPFSLNLMRSHERYPQYRSREDKILTIAHRINNCVVRPHNGIPLPYDSKEIIAIQAYLKWINSFVIRVDSIVGEKNLPINYINRSADPKKGEALYAIHCERCHQNDGAGKMKSDNISYEYPPLWGPYAYQPGSSMHRIVMQARWLKANMPYDKATWQNPILTDEEALDIAAYVNDDRIHQRPNPVNSDYPNPLTKPMDYGKGPYADTFPEWQHKFGPYQPIVDYWNANGMKLNR
jgi:thiosulfate dehydrogenase